MLQRNDTGSAHLLPTLDPPREVAPGEILDYWQLLDGFTQVDELDKDDHGAEVPPVAIVEAPEPVETGPSSLDSGISGGIAPPPAVEVVSDPPAEVVAERHDTEQHDDVTDQH